MVSTSLIFFNWGVIEIKLKYLVNVGVRMENSDFWLIRRGSLDKLGKPVYTYYREHIGIKVVSPYLLPTYLYYTMLNLYNHKYWIYNSYGSTNLKHIRVEDIRNLNIEGYRKIKI